MKKILAILCALFVLASCSTVSDEAIVGSTGDEIAAEHISDERIADTIGDEEIIVETGDDFVSSLEILDYGLYTHEIQGVKESEQSAYGETYLSTNFFLLEKTDQIPLEKEIVFGMRYRLNHDGDESVSGRFRMIFPEPGMYDPSRNEVLHETNKDILIEPGMVKFNGYMLEYGDEMIPGEWIFEYYIEDELVQRQVFNLYPSDPANSKKPIVKGKKK